MTNTKNLIFGGLILMSYSALASNITLISAPQVLAIPIVDNQDSWVDLRKQKLIAYGPSPEVEDNQDYTYLRKTVYLKLVAAQQKLPKGLRFCLYEGYRSLALQKMIFEKQYALVQKRHPNWAPLQLFTETTKLISPVINPDNTANIPPHSTGGAIDVYLIDEQGKPIDMGMHPKDWPLDKDGLISLTASKNISAPAQKNRLIMSNALQAEGFVNYPTEYWHWSYGDRYWAYIKKQSQAFYNSNFSEHK